MNSVFAFFALPYAVAVVILLHRVAQVQFAEPVTTKNDARMLRPLAVQLSQGPEPTEVELAVQARKRRTFRNLILHGEHCPSCNEYLNGFDDGQSLCEIGRAILQVPASSLYEPEDEWIRRTATRAKSMGAGLVILALLVMPAWGQATCNIGPDADTTLQFMNRMLGDRFILVASGGLAQILSINGYTPHQGAVISGHKYVNGQPELLYTIVQDRLGSDFELGDIDPKDIKSYRVLSAKGIAKAEVAAKDFSQPLPTGDLGAVIFHCRADSDSRCMSALVFDHPDSADRFVTAMRHLVTLCGGKPSAFEPTPPEK